MNPTAGLRVESKLTNKSSFRHYLKSRNLMLIITDRKRLVEGGGGRERVTLSKSPFQSLYLKPFPLSPTYISPGHEIIRLFSPLSILGNHDICSRNKEFIKNNANISSFWSVKYSLKVSTWKLKWFKWKAKPNGSVTDWVSWYHWYFWYDHSCYYEVISFEGTVFRDG